MKRLSVLLLAMILMAQSSALVGALSSIGNLSQYHFNTVVQWARDGAQRPNGYGPVADTERRILQLDHPDRVAVLYWLAGAGRRELYARGASDFQIGQRNPSAAPAATPTPNPWREVPIASSVLGGDTQRGIKIISAFAAAKKDGTAFIACFSFRNVAPKTAKEIDFSIPLYAPGAQSVGTLTLARAGTFSPNIDIHGYGSFLDWQKGSFGPASRSDNCVNKSYGTPQLPLLELQYASYAVNGVIYEDGTSRSPQSQSP